MVLEIGGVSKNLGVNAIQLPAEEITMISLLTILGKLYEEGVNFRTDRLYPEIEFPVSRGTPIISPLIKWNHSEDWFTAFYQVKRESRGGCRQIDVSTKILEWSFVKGHVIDGRNLFPATGYIYLVWESFAIMRESAPWDLNIIFENVKFHRATNVSEEKYNLQVMIQRQSGRFEVGFQCC